MDKNQNFNYIGIIKLTLQLIFIMFGSFIFWFTFEKLRNKIKQNIGMQEEDIQVKFKFREYNKKNVV